MNDWRQVKLIHIAGLPVKAGQQVVQRCAYCGTLLIDTRTQDTLADAVFVATWVPNSLIEVGPNGSNLVAYNEGDEAPDGFCGKPPQGATAH